MPTRKLAKIAVTALDDIKARDIAVLDVRKLTNLYDTLVIATAESNRQVKALAGHVREKLEAAGATIIGVEGEEVGRVGAGRRRRRRRPHHAAGGARALQPRGAVGRAQVARTGRRGPRGGVTPGTPARDDERRDPG